MLNIVLFGPPGSGKGTQAKQLAEKFNLLHISTGDLFRYEMGNDTPLGLKAKSYIEKGELVPDEVTIGMLRNKVEANPDVSGFIFDGFPRTIAQGEALDKLLSDMGTEVTKLIALEVEEQELIDRLLERGKDSGRADDQDPEIIRNRLNVYEEETAPVEDYYRKQDKAKRVDGMGGIDDVFERLCKEMEVLTA